MKSPWSPFVWAHILKQDKKMYGADVEKRLELYAKFHTWEQTFIDEVRAELAAIEQS
jgi:hypothetical protein